MQYADVAGGVAILLGDGHFVVDEQEAVRLQAAGVDLAYLCEWELPDGKHRIVTIPVG